jgi:lysozyme family protein
MSSTPLTPPASAAFSRALAHVLGAEGAWGADPHDRGNWTGGAVGVGVLNGTKFGISAAAYPHLDIAHLTLADVAPIYLADYWTPMRCDQLSPAVGFVCFDGAVQHGVGDMVEILQTAVGADVDGDFGPQTLACARKCPETETYLELCALRALHYAASSEWSEYGKGWMRRLMRTVAAAPAKGA